MKRNLSWGLFFAVLLMFVLSMLLPDIAAVVLAPTGVLISLVVLVIDIICKFFRKKEQVFKMFVNFMLVGKTCQLYDLQTASYFAGAIALVLAFVIVIFFAVGLDKLSEDAAKINKQ